MIIRKTAAALLCLALLLSLAGCGKSAYTYEFDGSGNGKLSLISYYAEDDLKQAIAEEDGQAAENFDYEKEGLTLTVIDGTNYLGKLKEYRFTTIKELKEALAVPVAGSDDPLSSVKNDLGDGLDCSDLSIFVKDGYKYFRLVFAVSSNLSSLRDDSESSGDAQPAPEDLTREDLESLRTMIAGDSTLIEVSSPLGVAIEGSCSTAEVSKNKVSIDYYAEYAKWLDDLEAALDKGRTFTEPEPLSFTITACMEKISALPFKDVADNAWYRDHVFRAYSRGMIEGVSDDLFSPDGLLTHAQAITLACRLRALSEGRELGIKNGEDVWWSTYLAFAKEAGITDSRSDSVMDDHVTRAEMAFYFSRALPDSFYKKTAENELSDIEGTEYADNIARLAESGIVDGYPDKTFRPGNEIKRSEAAAILSRFIDKL